MTYSETLSFLYSQLPMYQRDGASAYKANLDNTLALDEYFGHPHRTFKTIHIAGTNGKGSVSHMLASVLIQSGFKVGLYTSPHLKDFRERITINGKLIEQEFVTGFVENNLSIIDKLKPSFFELTVAMAFDYFRYQKVDIAVIETGMGGRLDSTNIIMPLLSIITNIGFDHTQFLGTTLEAIAAEKAGIIKTDTPVIIGEYNPTTAPVFTKVASTNNAPLNFADKRFSISNLSSELEALKFNARNQQSGTTFEITLDLIGLYQQKNTITALAALEMLVPLLNIEKQAIVAGLQNVIKNTGFKGRWQTIGHNPLMICDTAHNAHGMEWVTKQIQKVTCNNLRIVLGMVNDKKHDDVLKLLPTNAIYYFTKASIPRALNEELLYELAQKYNLSGTSYTTVPEAIEAARRDSFTDDFIFIGGSTFVVADVPNL